MPVVIDDRTNPGRTVITLAPVPCNMWPRPVAKASCPALVDPYTKFDALVRTPATLDSTTSVPWPCARNRRATASPDETAPT